MAEGRAAAAISRLNQISREMADRRALRERKAAAIKQQAVENLQKQGAVAERATKHLAELARRQKGAGGWVTEKALSNKDNVLGFPPEDEERADEEFPRLTGPAAPVPPPPTATPETAAPPESQPTQRKYSPSVAPPVAPEPPQPTPPPPPRRARHRRDEGFDDDDFSNNSWLT